MALEAGLAALKMLYQLAKMIKEARDNVLFVREKLDTTESIEEVIQMQLKRIEEGNSCPEAVIKAIKTRLVTTRRIARRMRMKYEPLVSLLSGMGGSAALIKAQASMLRRGILGASMALGTLSNMVRGHTDRSQKRALDALERALKAAGIEASIDEIRADPDFWIENSASNLKSRINSNIENSVDAVSKKANKAVDDVKSKIEDKVKEGIDTIDATQKKVQAKIGEAKDKVSGAIGSAKAQVGEAKDQLDKTINSVKKNIKDAKEQIGSDRLKTLKDQMPDEYAEVDEQEVDAYYDDFNAFENEIENAENSIKNLKVPELSINNLKNQSNAMKGKADDMQDKANQLVSQNQAKAKNFVSNQIDGLGNTVAHVVKHQLVLFEKLEELDMRIHNMLDDIDMLVEELKSLDKEAADEDDDESDNKTASSMKRETEMGLVPQGKARHLPPKEKYLESGLKMILKTMSDDKDTLDNRFFRKVMAGGYEEAKLNLLKRYICPGAYASYDERIITTEKFYEFLMNSGRPRGKPNVGIGIAAICTSLIAKLSTEGMPKIVQETGKIALDLIKPLIDHAFAFGIILQCEVIREELADDPEEIAALQAEADEASMEKRMELIQAFASDFRGVY